MLQRTAEITAASAWRKLHGINIPRSEVSFCCHHDLTGFCFVSPSIGGAAEIHLLGAEQHHADRSARALRQPSDQPSGCEGDSGTGAVVGGAGTKIPRIEMSTDENDLI